MSEEQGVDVGTEAEARREGWLPKEEFKGPESAWVDAETFVHRGKEINAILRKNNQRLEVELAQARGELSELGLTVKEFKEQFAGMRENAYKRAMKEVREELKAARQEGDVEKELAAEERLEQLREEKDQPAKEPPKPIVQTPPPNMEEFHRWHAENRWYDPQKDPELFDHMEGVALRLRREQPQLTGRAFLDEAAARVKKRFPDKFQNPNRQNEMVDGGGRAKGGGKKGKSYDDLPSEAKGACDRFVKQGLFKDREDYAKDYFAQEAA